MASLGVSRTHWPVVAWIRLKVPPSPAPMLLMGSAPPPPPPPLDLLEPNPIPTDPGRRIFSYEEERPEGWVLRLVWDSDEPETLEAEYRAPIYRRRLPRSEVPAFWAAVKEKTEPLGPLTVLASDPTP